MAAPSVSGGITVLHTCDTGGGTGVAPLAPSSLTGTSSLSSSGTRSAAYEFGINETGAGSIGIGASTFTEAVLGGLYAVTATDFTVANRFAVIHYRNSGSETSALTSSKGIMLAANSGSAGTEEAAFSVRGVDNWNAAYEAAIVNLNRSTDSYLYSGTFDPSDITHLGFAVSFAQTYGKVYVDSVGYVDPFIVVNGETANKGDFADITSNINTNDTGVNDSPTGNMHLCFFGWGVGDGTTATEFSETLKVWEFPETVDFTGLWGRAHINDNDLGFEVNASASDVIDFELCNWISDTSFYWNSIGSTSATVSYTSCVVKGAGELTVVDSHSFSGCLFDTCATITTNDPTLTSTTIKNATGVALDLDPASGNNLTNVTFSGNQTAIRVDTAGSTTLDVTECTFDSDNTYYIEYTGTGTLTVTASTSIAAGKLNASGGGTITVVAPDKGIVFSGLVAGSQVKVFATGTTTERFTTSSSGTSETYTATVEEDIDYTIYLAGRILIRVTGYTVGATQTTVLVNQEVDRAYVASSGLTYTTHTSATAGTKIFTLNTDSTLQNYYSHMVEEWIAQATLKNVEFPIVPNGSDSFTLKNGWEFSSATDIAFLSRDGMRYLDATDTLTATWAAILSIGDTDTMTAEYQQVDGAAPTNAANTGDVDELIQVYGDATHGNFDYTGYMVIKYQENGYMQGVVDVVDTYGTLADALYVVAVQPTAIADFTTGDPALANPPVITDHGATPTTWNSKDFSITITDSAAGNTGDDIMRWINYNLAQDATFEGSDPFNWPDMVVESGDDYATERGDLIGSAGAALKGIRVVKNDGTTSHADFIKHMADDGTYYTVPVTATAAVTGMPTAGANIRLQITNETGRAGTTWSTGQSVTAGDYYLRSTGVGAENSNTGLFFVANNSGTTHATTEPTWDTTAGNTTVDNDITWTCRAVQYHSADPATANYSSNYTTGEEFAAGDTARIRFSELNGATTFNTFAQNAVVTSTGFSVACDETADAVYATNADDGSLVTKFTADFTNVEIDLSANENFHSKEAYSFYCYQLTTADGIEMFWDGVVAADTGNYKIVTATLNLYFDNTTTASKRQTDSARIYRDDDTYPVKDPTTSGYGVDVNWKSQVYVVEVSTGNAVNQATVQAALTAQGYTTTRAPYIDDVKTKTDQLTFTNTGEVDSNTKSMNDSEVLGSGIDSDLWRG